MKKRFTAFICLLLIATMLFCSCTISEEETKPPVLTEEKTEKPTETGVPTGRFEEVSDVNGKTARSIVEDFYRDYAEASSFDLVITTSMKIDGETFSERVELKINENDMYMLMESEGSVMKIWSVGGMLYIDMDGEKIKTVESMEDYMGIDVGEMLSSYVPESLHPRYLEKLEETQIYRAGDHHYFKVDITAEEAEAMDGIGEGYTETFYCNSNGTVKDIDTVYDNGDRSGLILISYGKPVSITAPQNADEFIVAELGGIGGDWEEDWMIDWEDDMANDFEECIDIDIEAYATYRALCELLSSEASFSMKYGEGSTSIAFYQTDGRDKYICDYALGSSYQTAWLVNGVGYATKNNSVVPARIDTNTQEFIELVNTVEELVGYICVPIHYRDMTYMYEGTEINGRPFVHFGRECFTAPGAQTPLEYDREEIRYTFLPSGEEIQVKITRYGRQGVIATLDYRFSGIGSNIDIVAPILN